MTTLLLHHDAGLSHEGPPGHPERPDRLRAIAEALSERAFEPLVRREAPRAEVDAIARVHPESFIERVRKAEPESGITNIDADTYLSPGSYEAVLRCIGAGVAAVDAVLDGEVANGFCSTRPPGHHAERERAMGFCLFNGVAIAARHAREVRGLDRVAIMDFDVHHGNGTQDVFWDDATVMYASTHQMPLYPGTGAPSETGSAGTILNVPLSPGDGGPEFRTAMQGAVLPRIAAFEPDLLLISAGFDAHMRDPLAQLNLVEDDFAWATRALMDVADATCDGRVVSVLEGGYDLTGLSRSVAVHVKTLMTA